MAEDETVSDDMNLRVAGIRDLTSHIKYFEMVGADGGDLPRFEAGAHIDVATGDGRIRSYSLANDPAEHHRYQLAILREKESRGGSAWMHDQVSDGDILTAKPPLNNFELEEEASEHVFIAGGIGITPILSMGYRLSAIGAEMRLHYCTRTPEATAFRGEVGELFQPNLTFHHDGGDPAKGIKLDEVLAERSMGAYLYVCGPQALMDAALQAADHWPLYSVNYETFAAVEDADGGLAKESFEIELGRANLSLTVPADKSILEVVEEAGIEVESSCGLGHCGTCRTGLLGGAADHRDGVLNDAERADGKLIQICCSRAMPGEKLILDI